MIPLDHKYFEKLGGPVYRSLRGMFDKLVGPVEHTIASNRLQSTISSESGKISSDKKKKYKGMSKVSKLQPMPKVEKSGLRMAKKTTLDDTESHSLRRAIERSKGQDITTVSKSTEPVYAGGNTASNMRGVMRAEEKSFRKKMKKSFGKHSRIKKSRFYS